jgi:TctA family transporter
MPKFGTSFPTLAEFISVRWAVVRSVILGFFAGILPGIGATLAAFLSYNEAVRWSKTPENRRSLARANWKAWSPRRPPTTPPPAPP